MSAPQDIFILYVHIYIYILYLSTYSEEFHGLQEQFGHSFSAVSGVASFASTKTAGWGWWSA